MPFSRWIRRKWLRALPKVPAQTTAGRASLPSSSTCAGCPLSVAPACCPLAVGGVAGCSATQRRLAMLGVKPGVPLTVEHNLGAQVIIRVQGCSTISLSTPLADCVTVAPVQPALNEAHRV